MKPLDQMTNTELGDEARRITAAEVQAHRDWRALASECQRRDLWVTTEGVERRPPPEKF